MHVAFACEAGSTATLNEDTVLATPRLVIVIDGVTAPAGLQTGCIHGTPWYVTQLASHVIVRDASAPGLALQAVLYDALTCVKEAHEGSCDLGADGTPSATVAILREGQDMLDYLVLSDATVVLEHAEETTVVTDDRLAGLFGSLRSAVQSAPAGSDEREARLRELVATQRKLRNVEGGYWLAGAAPRAAEHAITGSVSRDVVTSAAVMTDGASRLVDLFNAEQWDSALAWLGTHTPRAWIDRVRQIEATDMKLERWPRYKHSDDAAVAYITF